jgi:RNA polymerase sigma factor (sigma-70 family)
MSRDVFVPAEGVDLRGLPEDFSRTQRDLVAWKAGDERAFDSLWRRYRPALEVLIAGRIRASVQPALRARLDADDVLQDVALTVFGKLDAFEYRGPGSVLAWMTKIAEHTIGDWIDHWSAGKRHPRVELPASWTDPSGTRHAALAALTGGPVTDASQRERRRRLAAAMATLSERDHRIVLWRFFGGASWTEIAAEVGATSAEAVRKECYLKVFPALAAALASR